MSNQHPRGRAQNHYQQNNQAMPIPYQQVQQRMLYMQYGYRPDDYANMQYYQQVMQPPMCQPPPPPYMMMPPYQPYMHPQYQTQYRFNQQQQYQQGAYNPQQKNSNRGGHSQRFNHQRNQQRPKPNRFTPEKKAEPESDHSSGVSDEEEKLKTISVVDSPQEIKKWVEARKRNYPTRKRIQQKAQRREEQEQAGQLTKHELSKLEIKLRKSIQFGSSSGRSIEMKAKNLQVIRSIIVGPARRMKPIRKREPMRPQTNKYRERNEQPHEPVGETLATETPAMGDQALEKPIARTQPVDSRNRAEEMIESLKVRRQKDRQMAQKMFNYKQNSSNFHYMKNTLTANMIVQDVFKENCYLLQAIRYLVKTDFLERPDEPPKVQIPSEHEQHSSQDELVEVVVDEVEEGEIEQGEFQE